MDTKGRLLALRCPEREVDIEGVGTVKVRGLTRKEVASLAGDEDTMEARSIALAMLDPKLTADEAVEFHRTAPFGVVDQITDAINELSGIGKRAVKETYKSVPDEPEPGG